MRCWPYTGYITTKGYGRTIVGGRSVLTHKAAYEAMVGPVPEGLELDHLCRNRACYNPWHLEPVTHAENVRRSVRPYKTHCKRGHLFDEFNTLRYAAGKRTCRICTLKAGQDYRERRKNGTVVRTIS